MEITGNSKVELHQMKNPIYFWLHTFYTRSSCINPHEIFFVLKLTDIYHNWKRMCPIFCN